MVQEVFLCCLSVFAPSEQEVFKWPKFLGEFGKACKVITHNSTSCGALGPVPVLVEPGSHQRCTQSLTVCRQCGVRWQNIYVQSLTTLLNKQRMTLALVPLISLKSLIRHDGGGTVSSMTDLPSVTCLFRIPLHSQLPKVQALTTLHLLYLQMQLFQYYVDAYFQLSRTCSRIT